MLGPTSRRLPRPEPTPLTARFVGMPAEHNGTDAFTFRIAFSDGINISYKTFRDHSLEVTGGSVTKARRVNRRRDLWEITVEPNADADVSVVLPVTEDCSTQGAVLHIRRQEALQPRDAASCRPGEFPMKTVQPQVRPPSPALPKWARR